MTVESGTRCCVAVPVGCRRGQSEGHCILRSGRGLGEHAEPLYQPVPGLWVVPPHHHHHQGQLLFWPLPLPMLVLASQTGRTTVKNAFFWILSLPDE